MRHQDLETEAQNLLRRIVRTVDKRIQLQVNDGPTPQDPMLSVALTSGHQHATMELSVEGCAAPAEYARLGDTRERVKRTHERLRFPEEASASSTPSHPPRQRSVRELPLVEGRTARRTALSRSTAAVREAQRCGLSVAAREPARTRSPTTPPRGRLAQAAPPPSPRRSRPRLARQDGRHGLTRDHYVVEVVLDQQGILRGRAGVRTRSPEQNAPTPAFRR